MLYEVITAGSPSPASLPVSNPGHVITSYSIHYTKLYDFKVKSEDGRRTVYLRVYSGKVSEGDLVRNASTGEKERVARLFRIHAGKKERIARAQAGEIVGARNNFV